MIEQFYADRIAELCREVDELTAQIGEKDKQIQKLQEALRPEKVYFEAGEAVDDSL